MIVKMVPMHFKSILLVTVLFSALHINEAQFNGMIIDCKPRKVPHLVQRNSCTSKEIFIEICEGTCRSLTAILMNKPLHNVLCECCKHTGLEYRNVELSCGGRKEIERIPSVTGCQCKVCSS
ncbi:hypothetical protein AC249_AIPGENE8930 [Exaiptasia diaphana]|nr:hypothetical protein AC249_AIPGENE8930 [Exaiptasia diaphana]